MSGFRELFPEDCEWLAIPFGDEHIAKVKDYGNGYVPCLTIITPSGKVIDKGQRPDPTKATEYMDEWEKKGAEL
jgi:hypothetical protein